MRALVSSPDNVCHGKGWKLDRVASLDWRRKQGDNDNIHSSLMEVHVASSTRRVLFLSSNTTALLRKNKDFPSRLGLFLFQKLLSFMISPCATRSHATYAGDSSFHFVLCLVPCHGLSRKRFHSCMRFAIKLLRPPTDSPPSMCPRIRVGAMLFAHHDVKAYP